LDEVLVLRPRYGRRIAIVGAVTATLFIGGGLGIGLTRGSGLDSQDGTRTVALAERRSTDTLASPASGDHGQIARLQRLLATQPDDAASWAALGAAYVQQARISLDPTYYPKAQGALERSLRVRPKDNLPALVGLGALANSRHDFVGAARWGRKAVSVSPYNPSAYGVLADAYTQLGRAADATRAVQKMLDLSPALPALTRGSYDLEQRGDRAGAIALMQRALDDAFAAADIGFCRYYLGELAFAAGDLSTAERHYSAGLAADPQSAPLRQGKAKIEALRGDTAGALRDYAVLVERVPNPQYVVEYGELLTKAGRVEEARAQFTLVETLHQIFAANGGQDDLALAEFEADHGNAKKAVTYARAEWQRRQSVVVADALAWALHRAGRDSEALTFADRALSRGWRNALFFHHRAEIRRALGDGAGAAADEQSVRRNNPEFDRTLPAFGRPT
jgi:tetratricopeptide (TPR) repeat protein